VQGAPNVRDIFLSDVEKGTFMSTSTYRLVTKDESLIQNIVDEVSHARELGSRVTCKVDPPNSLQMRGFTKHVYVYCPSEKDEMTFKMVTSIGTLTKKKHR
jgi:hypothetical protein